MHQQLYREDLMRFRFGRPLIQGPYQIMQPPLRRHVAAINRDLNGSITGLVWVVLRKLPDELNLGSHAYFQRMYVTPQSRSPGSSHRLFMTFLDGFKASDSSRDHRAAVLLAENVNSGLHTAAARRYFARYGFRFLGSNHLGSELWSMCLKTRFIF